mmetsp:Transcript_44406/g.121003  ORF Transcript_44406/g.121003 Transcript_44406/m.121003 type:complete len:270 (+) Transcript_44406:617-1426(+)
MAPPFPVEQGAHRIQNLGFDWLGGGCEGLEAEQELVDPAHEVLLGALPRRIGRVKEVAYAKNDCEDRWVRVTNVEDLDEVILVEVIERVVRHASQMGKLRALLIALIMERVLVRLQTTPRVNHRLVPEESAAPVARYLDLVQRAVLSCVVRALHGPRRRRHGAERRLPRPLVRRPETARSGTRPSIYNLTATTASAWSSGRPHLFDLAVNRRVVPLRAAADKVSRLAVDVEIVLHVLLQHRLANGRRHWVRVVRFHFPQFILRSPWGGT